MTELLPPIAERIWGDDLLERVCVRAECMTLDEAFRVCGVPNWRNAVLICENEEARKRNATRS